MWLQSGDVVLQLIRLNRGIYHEYAGAHIFSLNFYPFFWTTSPHLKYMILLIAAIVKNLRLGQFNQSLKANSIA